MADRYAHGPDRLLDIREEVCALHPLYGSLYPVAVFTAGTFHMYGPDEAGTGYVFRGVEPSPMDVRPRRLLRGCAAHIDALVRRHAALTNDLSALFDALRDPDQPANAGDT